MLNWIEQRTGFVSMTKGLLTEDIPGGASYWYVFGSATLFAMILQIVTGIFLTFFYAPSANTAWESTRAMYANPFQHFVLSLHYWGASAMIALLFLHLLQVVIFGAYKSPRELQWVVGVMLLLVTMVLGLTGYLLPWDLDAYAASQVAINLTLQMPVVGQYVQYFAQDGTTLGTLTINRFFGLHVWLMPAALVALVGAHLAIFRWNGPAGPPVADPRPLKSGRFWPDQMFMDTVVSFGIFVIIVFLSFVFPPFLDLKADPANATFIPYPAWYFLDLFGLLNLVPGAFEIVGAIIIPGIATMILFLLPWIDRSTTRTTGSRKFILWVTAISMVFILGLTFWSQAGIVAKQQAVPPPPPPAMTNSTATTSIAATPAKTVASTSGLSPTASAKAGASVFTVNCSSCHGATGQGMPGAFPPLANNPLVTGDPGKVIDIVRNGLHGTITVNGAAYNGVMPSWKGSLSNGDIANVITYIRGSLGSNKASAVTQAQVAAAKP
ncbi:MAG TPA: cytochrome b N-terminal domain-containing protein [Verrucomicrobiae bacterium]|jgi:ubiquinol-cytochrome c reductase cytochrome b subunit|nr:cytochrome b N-terminal domain-containing protein [Verrucomicrobiae bacterium]